MFTTNMQIQKWTDRPKTRKRCGRNLYIRIFGNGSKTFEMRTRQEWITLGQYPALSLADASKIVSISKRLLKSRTITTKALRILIIQATSAQNLEYLASDKLSPDITPSEVITFDQALTTGTQPNSKPIFGDIKPLQDFQSVHITSMSKTISAISA